MRGATPSTAPIAVEIGPPELTTSTRSAPWRAASSAGARRPRIGEAQVRVRPQRAVDPGVERLAAAGSARAGGGMLGQRQPALAQMRL